MPIVNVQIEGLNDLLAKINTSKDITKTAVAAAIATVADEVAKEAQANHSFENKTGNLEASIMALPVEETDDGKLVGVVQAGMEYAYWVEFGTSKMPARPYLTPAVEANKQNLLDTIAAAIDRSNQVVGVK